MGYVSDSFEMATVSSSSSYRGIKYTSKTFAQLVPFGSSVEDVRDFLSKFAISKLYFKFPHDYNITTRVTLPFGTNKNPIYGGIWKEAYIVPMFNPSNDHQNFSTDMPSGGATHPRDFEYINCNKDINAYPVSGAANTLRLLDLDINRTCITLNAQYCYKDTTDAAGGALQYTLADDQDLKDLPELMRVQQNIPTIQSLSFYFLNDSNNWVKCNNITLMAITLNVKNAYNAEFIPITDITANYSGIAMSDIFFNNSSTNQSYQGAKIIPMSVVPQTSGDKGYLPYAFKNPPRTAFIGWHDETVNPFIADLRDVEAKIKIEYPEVNQVKSKAVANVFYNSTFLSNFWQGLQGSSSYFAETGRVMFNRKKVEELVRYVPIPFVNTLNNMNACKTLEEKVNNGHWYFPYITDNGTTNSVSGDDINDLGYLKDNPDGDISFGGGHTNGKVTDDDSSMDYNPNTPMNIPALSTIGVFNTTYAISQNTLNRFAAYFWNDDDATYDELIENLGMFNNPIDGIIGVRLFPLDLTSVGTGVASADTDIVLGRSVLPGIQGRKLFPNWKASIDMGSLKYYPRYGNFLDYEPYATATLYLPYIGSIELACNYFLNKTVNIKYIVDITTGACTAMIYSDGTLIKSVDGVCGIEIPISAANRQDYVFNKMNNEVKTTTDAIGGASSVIGQLATGDVAGAFSSAVGAASSYAMNKLQGKEIKADITKSSASTPTCSLWEPQNCYLIIERSQVDIPSSYGHNVGYMLNKTRKLSDLNGFTTCANPHLDGIIATDSEKSMICNALVSGVIL